jgi:hypothetical protein
MAIDIRWSPGPAPVVRQSPPQPPLDYYLLLGGTDPGQPIGLVVEEFSFAEDYATVGLDSAGWTIADDRWWSSAQFSRDMRMDPQVRARVYPVHRREAEVAFHRLGAGRLPEESTLRAYFRDPVPLTASAPLRLDNRQVPYGFRDMRTYRILFANELTETGMANLRALWKLNPVENPIGRRSHVVGATHLRVGRHVFTWELRWIGRGVAWCVDVTVYLAGGPDHVVGMLLRELTTAARQQGLIPVTVERFS